MTLDYITSIDVQPGKGKQHARGSFVVADALAINFSVFKGEKGDLRVVLPSTPNPKFDASQPASKDNKKYWDEVRPISKDVREALVAYILENVDGGIAAPTDSIPF